MLRPPARRNIAEKSLWATPTKAAMVIEKKMFSTRKIYPGRSASTQGLEGDQKETRRLRQPHGGTRLYGKAGASALTEWYLRVVKAQ